MLLRRHVLPAEFLVGVPICNPIKTRLRRRDRSQFNYFIQIQLKFLQKCSMRMGEAPTVTFIYLGTRTSDINRRVTHAIPASFVIGELERSELKFKMWLNTRRKRTRRYLYYITMHFTFNIYSAQRSRFYKVNDKKHTTRRQITRTTFLKRKFYLNTWMTYGIVI